MFFKTQLAAFLFLISGIAQAAGPMLQSSYSVQQAVNDPVRNQTILIGDFDRIGKGALNLKRNGMAAIDNVSKEVTAWAPSFEFTGDVQSKITGAVVHQDSLYVSTFEHALWPSSALWKYDLRSDRKVLLIPAVQNKLITSLAINDRLLLVGGRFTYKDERYSGLTKFDLETEAALDWTLEDRTPVDQFVVFDGHVLTCQAGKLRGYDFASGQRNGIEPVTFTDCDSAQQMEAKSGKVYIVARFQKNPNVLVWDPATKRETLLLKNPKISDSYENISISFHRDQIYLAGGLNGLDGQRAFRRALFDEKTLAPIALPTFPGKDLTPFLVFPIGDEVYMSGSFYINGADLSLYRWD